MQQRTEQSGKVVEGEGSMRRNFGKNEQVVSKGEKPQAEKDSK